MSASFLRNFCLSLRSSGISAFAGTSAFVQGPTATDVSAVYLCVHLSIFLTVKHIHYIPTFGWINNNHCYILFTYENIPSYVHFCPHFLFSVSQAAGFAGSHQWEGRKHRPAGVILLQTKESPGGSDGSEEGERQAHAPAQTAGTSTTCDHQAI